MKSNPKRVKERSFEHPGHSRGMPESLFQRPKSYTTNLISISRFYNTWFIETRGSRGRCEKKIELVREGGTSLQESDEKCRRDYSIKRNPCDKFLIRHIDQPVLIEPAFCARKGWTFESEPRRPGSFTVSRAADTEVEGGEGDLRFAGYET